MTRNPILGLPLNEVMRSDIALPLQQVLLRDYFYSNDLVYVIRGGPELLQ